MNPEIADGHLNWRSVGKYHRKRLKSRKAWNEGWKVEGSRLRDSCFFTEVIGKCSFFFTPCLCDTLMNINLLKGSHFRIIKLQR